MSDHQVEQQDTHHRSKHSRPDDTRTIATKPRRSESDARRPKRDKPAADASEAVQARQVSEAEPSRRWRSRHAPEEDDQHHKAAKAPTTQSMLTEEKFQEYLDGYERIEALDLYKVSLGGRMRYVTETLDGAGKVINRQYRLGGILIKVDRDLRFVTLKNTRIDPRGGGGQANRPTWSVQLRTPNTKMRLYYMAPPSSEEVIAFRKVLQDIDDGTLELRVKKSKSKD